jgi:hypothetical protein
MAAGSTGLTLRAEGAASAKAAKVIDDAQTVSKGRFIGAAN